MTNLGEFELNQQSPPESMLRLTVVHRSTSLPIWPPNFILPLSVKPSHTMVPLVEKICEATCLQNRLHLMRDSSDKDVWDICISAARHGGSGWELFGANECYYFPLNFFFPLYLLPSFDF